MISVTLKLLEIITWNWKCNPFYFTVEIKYSVGSCSCRKLVDTKLTRCGWFCFAGLNQCKGNLIYSMSSFCQRQNKANWSWVLGVHSIPRPYHRTKSQMQSKCHGETLLFRDPCFVCTYFFCWVGTHIYPSNKSGLGLPVGSLYAIKCTEGLCQSCSIEGWKKKINGVFSFLLSVIETAWKIMTFYKYNSQMSQLH